MKTYLSIIVPVYNEEKRIRKIKQIDNYLRKQSYSSEIVIVNDGSSDSTLEVLKSIKLVSKFALISYKNNKGKGHAIRKGVRNASGKYILFTDVDLSTPLAFTSKFLKKAESGSHVVIGSRKKSGATLIQRQTPLREYLGKGFTMMSQVTLGLSISDFTCGYKLFHKKAAKKIFSAQKIDKWGFDAEILFLAKKYGFTIEEIPVKWKDNSFSRVKLPEDIIHSLKDLANIHYYNMKGEY